LEEKKSKLEEKRKEMEASRAREDEQWKPLSTPDPPDIYVAEKEKDLLEDRKLNLEERKRKLEEKKIKLLEESEEVINNVLKKKW
jgi:hypothetical protein